MVINSYSNLIMVNVFTFVQFSYTSNQVLILISMTVI